MLKLLALGISIEPQWRVAFVLTACCTQRNRHKVLRLCWMWVGLANPLLKAKTQERLHSQQTREKTLPYKSNSRTPLLPNICALEILSVRVYGWSTQFLFTWECYFDLILHISVDLTILGWQLFSSSSLKILYFLLSSLLLLRI